jgi:hypothetical protein
MYLEKLNFVFLNKVFLKKKKPSLFLVMLKLTIVCYERDIVCKKNRNLLEKKIVTNNCLLREEDNILNLEQNLGTIL